MGKQSNISKQENSENNSLNYSIVTQNNTYTFNDIDNNKETEIILITESQELEILGSRNLPRNEEYDYYESNESNKKYSRKTNSDNENCNKSILEKYNLTNDDYSENEENVFSERNENTRFKKHRKNKSNNYFHKSTDCNLSSSMILQNSRPSSSKDFSDIVPEDYINEIDFENINESEQIEIYSLYSQNLNESQNEGNNLSINEELFLGNDKSKKSPIILVQNLSSSGLKRRIKKNNHCRFCNENKSRLNLEEHLLESVICGALYMRENMVRSIDAVLVKIFACLNCPMLRNTYLKPHLQKESSCLQYYRNKFNLNSVIEICQKIKKLKKQGQESRQSVARKLEYKNTKLPKTVTESLNEYKRSIALANFRLCCICLGHYLQNFTSEIKVEDPKFTNLELDINPQMKRMNMFFMCNFCNSSKQKIDEKLVQPFLKFVTVNGIRIYYPKESYDNSSIEDNEIPALSYVMFPKKVGKSIRIQRHQINIYKCEKLRNRHLSTIYNNQLFKYYIALLYAERFEGEINPISKKSIQSLRPIVDYSEIRHSDVWYMNKMNGIESRFEAYGPSAISFKLDIPINNKESICTAILIQGTVLTVEYHGNENHNMTTKYFIHNHNVEKKCDESCSKEEVTDEDCIGQQLRTKYISIFISTISQKMNGIVKYIINNEHCNLSAKEFYVGVLFPDNKKACIEGILWTKECDKFNEFRSKQSLKKNIDLGNEYLKYIENTISTTTTIEELRRYYSENEADKIIKKIKENQINITTYDETEIPLPSLFSLFSRRPTDFAFNNLFQSRLLNSFLRNMINELSNDSKCKMTTIDWLDDIKNNSHIRNIMHGNKGIISISLSELDIEFIMDDTLNKMISEYDDTLIAIYHYSISCRSRDYEIILKRLSLIECFTTPYNLDLFRATNEKVEVTPIHSFAQWNLLHQNLTESKIDIENSPLSHLLDTHTLMSVPELIAIADPKKIREIVSNKCEYVNTQMKKKLTFKKTNQHSKDTFNNSENKEEAYVKLSSNVIRHANRLNGEELLLAETCMWYDALSRKDAAEVHRTFEKNLENIPISDIESIYGEFYMPTYILCKYEQVLKIRSTKKVLHIIKYAKDSDEHKYSEISLYYPLLPGTDVDLNRLGNNYLFN